jgi:two-component system, NtrC family, response regulator
MQRVLIVDDDTEIRETMSSLLGRRNIPHDEARDLSSTRDMLKKNRYDLILLDVGLPDGSGLDLLPEIRSLETSPEVIILTGKGDSEGAALAIERGVWDYLLKPSSVKEISLSIARALKYREQKTISTPKALDLTGVVGKSPAMQTCFELVARASASDSNMLITGETGVGKELLARVIHANSLRREKPFVVLDCASITPTLVESTLFGHRKGAFTGALSHQPGLICQAHQGTLFLDELGELPPEIQKSLLRVLQERRYRPVGGSKELSSDFRLIAATNRNLEDMIQEATFRSDLYFRVKTMHINLPPLRERPEDIRPLAMHFMDGHCEKLGIPGKGFGADFMETLKAYPWPGNVRELSNVMEQTLVACAGETNLYAPHLPTELRIRVARDRVMGRPPERSPSPETGPDDGSCPDPGSRMPSLKEHKQDCEKQYLDSLLQKGAGDVPLMLKISGLSRSHFYSLLKKYNLDA